MKPKFISKLGATTTIIADHLSETNRSTNNIELETYDDLVAEDGSVSFILKLSFIHKLKNEIALNNDVLKKLQEQDESLGKEFFLNMVADTIQGIEIVDGKKVLPIKFVVSNFYGDSKSFKAYLDIVSLLR